MQGREQCEKYNFVDIFRPSRGVSTIAGLFAQAGVGAAISLSTAKSPVLAPRIAAPACHGAGVPVALAQF